ncbi:beta-ketoacyl-ACP synthase [Sneathiella sp. P13V-1]|uniref:beta-ketoacyl-[acyl-carrier-protein] synthase family protein n=1 Tax=Sneathiella sp. P13V-1 TaxID=2697366 RepID=UPI00187B4104|nr:beta-ketoacyl-[acyl-carrier-protein] synthase family protein [Sneathiella sp. P13V-1]MBE7636511.1 beta-ketoacyl-ACP synthase [Sneathiella sp. P13V-1]
MSGPLYLCAMGMISPLGADKESTYNALLAGDQSGMVRSDHWTPGQMETVGMIKESSTDLPSVATSLNSRNNQYLYQVALQIDDEIKKAVDTYGASRVAVIIGTSNSGIEESEKAMRYRHEHGSFPADYNFGQQEIGSPSLFLAEIYGIKGPVYSVSAACASGGKAFSTAARLINAGFCDAAIVGGADTLCSMTVGGFRSLQALSDDICNPLSANRNGTNIGEGIAVFVMTKEKSDIAFIGAGESSDAHHVSAPEPNGEGAERAMRQALELSNLNPEDISYLNMHGTATELNDSMEAKAIARVFEKPIPVSSTKPMTGHTLGAAGAVEAAILWLCLHYAEDTVSLPPHLWDGCTDEDVPDINLAQKGDTVPASGTVYLMSNSFAFGGSNVSIIMGKGV